MKKILIFVIFMLLSLSVFAVDFPEPTGYVNDFANIFSEQEQQGMESLLDQIEKNSTVEIAVVTIPSLEGLSKEQYAVELFEKWKIGKKDVDNGLLILIAPNEREYRIEVGYGLEGVITDTMAGIVGRKNFVENFRAEKYGAGVKDAILDFKGLIEKDPTVISEIERNKEKGMQVPLWFSGLIGFSGLIALFAFLIVLTVIMRFATKKQKKSKSTATRLIAGAILFILIWLIFNVFVAVIAFIFYIIFVMIPLKSGFFIGGPGYRGGFRGGFGGGGFGGFGGGGSGGGGAGGGW